MNEADDSPGRVVFLFDVDNTLLDNDRVAADLQRHFAMKSARRVRKSIGGLLSSSEPSSATRITSARCNVTALSIRAPRTC